MVEIIINRNRAVTFHMSINGDGAVEVGVELEI